MIDRIIEWSLRNRFIVVCVLILVAMVVSGSLLAAFFMDRHQHPFSPYISTDSLKPAVDGVLSVGTFIICYQVRNL